MAPKLISKAEAIKRGLKTYDGEPCKRGHDGRRFTKGGKCVECTLEATRKIREKAKTTKGKAVVSSGKLTNGGNNVVAEGRASAWGGLVRRLKVLIEKGDKAAEKAEQFYNSAGLTIKEIKEKFPDNWEAIVRDECGIGRSRAYELISIADGRATLASIRASTNERQKTLKAKSQSVITDDSEAAPIRVFAKVIKRQDEPTKTVVAKYVDAESVEVTPPQDVDIAEIEAPPREFGPYILNTEDDDAAVAGKLLEWFGGERARRVIAVMEKLIREKVINLFDRQPEGNA